MALQMAERALQCNYIRKDPQTTLSSMGPGAWGGGPGTSIEVIIFIDYSFGFFLMPFYFEKNWQKNLNKFTL